MARGKNKAVAERRKEALQEIGSINNLHTRIKELTQENARLKSQAEQDLVLHNEQVLDLSRRLDKGTSADMERLQKENDELLAAVHSSSSEYENIREKWTKAVLHLQQYFIEKEDLGPTEAFEKVVVLTGYRDEAPVLDVQNTGKFMVGDSATVAERIKRLQRIRGLR